MKNPYIRAVCVASLSIANCLWGTQVFSASLNIEGDGRINGDLEMVNHQIHNVADPSSDQDVATKAYVDGIEARATLNPNQVALKRWYDANRAGRKFETQTAPGGIAFDGENIWVGNHNDDSLSIFRASDGQLLSTYSFSDNFGYTCAPYRLAYDGEYMWVTCFQAGVVKLVRARDVASFPFMDISVAGARFIAFDGANMWVSNNVDGSVRVIQASTGTELHNLAGSASFPVTGMAFDGTNMWLTTTQQAVAVLPVANPTSASYFYMSGAGAYDIAFDGTNMWITNWASDTVTVAGPTRTFLGEFSVGLKPTGLVFDGARMWILNEDADSADLFRVSDLSHLDTVTLGDRPIAGAFDGANVWITLNLDNEVGKY